MLISMLIRLYTHMLKIKDSFTFTQGVLSGEWAFTVDFGKGWGGAHTRGTFNGGCVLIRENKVVARAFHKYFR